MDLNYGNRSRVSAVTMAMAGHAGFNVPDYLFANLKIVISFAGFEYRVTVTERFACHESCVVCRKFWRSTLKQDRKEGPPLIELESGLKIL